MRQKELFKEEIIHQLELHPSRLDKEKIISEAMEQGLDDFFEGIRMALDPLVTFGVKICLLYTSPSPRDATTSRMPSSA